MVGLGFIVIVVVFIICATVLAKEYMWNCRCNNTKMFPDSRHEERIRKLEKQMEELKKE